MSKAKKKGWRYEFTAEMSGSHTCHSEETFDLVDDLGEDADALAGMSEKALEEVVRAHWEEWFWNICNGGFNQVD